MPTLEEIAQLSQVSRSTVSRVINDDPHVKAETRKRVMAVVQRLNYHPHAVARSLAAGRTQILGLIVPYSLSATFQDPFLPPFLQGVTHACNDHGYSLMLWLAEPEYERRMVNQILRNGLLDGVIVWTIHLSDEIVESLSRSEIPFIFIGQHAGVVHVDASYVDVENRRGAREAVAYLMRLGRRRVAHIAGPLDTVTARDRRAGYLDALRARGREANSHLITQGDFSEASGYMAMQRLIEAEPDAVFAGSDLMAMGAVRALREAGLEVPDDVAVVGFDDIPASASFDPPLTSVRQPSQRMGSVATETLIDAIEQHGLLQHRIVLPTQLIVRRSCGASC